MTDIDDAEADREFEEVESAFGITLRGRYAKDGLWTGA